jgi:hypothetical protein
MLYGPFETTGPGGMAQLSQGDRAYLSDALSRSADALRHLVWRHPSTVRNAEQKADDGFLLRAQREQHLDDLGAKPGKFFLVHDPGSSVTENREPQSHGAVVLR